MKELSLNVLDIAENSVKAGAEHVSILLDQVGNQLTVSITDDGCGMSPEFLAAVPDHPEGGDGDPPVQAGG